MAHGVYCFYTGEKLAYAIRNLGYVLFIMRTDHMMRLFCLPEQLVRSSEQFVLIDTKGVLLGPDVRYNSCIQSHFQHCTLLHSDMARRRQRQASVSEKDLYHTNYS